MTVVITPCHDARCILVVCSQPISLLPTKATLVHTLDRLLLPEGYGLTVIQQHLRPKHWRVVERHCFPSTHLYFTLLTTQETTLTPGQILCHVQCTPLTLMYMDITGKLKY